MLMQHYREEARQAWLNSKPVKEIIEKYETIYNDTINNLVDNHSLMDNSVIRQELFKCKIIKAFLKDLKFETEE